MEQRIFLSSPTMHGEEQAYIREAFDRNWIAPLGFNCDGFEAEAAQYLKTAGDGYKTPLYALCLVSGTAALHLSVKLAGLKPGDVALCSDLTFSATVNPVSYEGGIQVFVDSERETWNMDPAALEKAFRLYPGAKAVVLAHLYGTPAKLDEIIKICEAHSAVLIEDAAEALAATYRGRACGTFGKYGILSFNGNKIITTSGGGMLLTGEASEREKALFWATQAREPAPWYQHEELGYNYRLSNICAGIGRGQLKHLEEHRSRKEEIYRRYAEAFRAAGLPVTMNPYREAESRPNFWLSCLLIEQDCPVGWRALYDALAAENIESRPIWKPMHMQPFYRDRAFVSVEDVPVGEDIFSRGLCLPSDIKMTEAQQDIVIELVKRCF